MLSALFDTFCNIFVVFKAFTIVLQLSNYLRIPSGQAVAFYITGSRESPELGFKSGSPVEVEQASDLTTAPPSCLGFLELYIDCYK